MNQLPYRQYCCQDGVKSNQELQYAISGHDDTVMKQSPCILPS